MASTMRIIHISPSWFLSFIALLALSILMALISASASSPPPPPPPGCTSRELLLLSPCLPFISAPPNNLSNEVPSACCGAFSSVHDSGTRICLCYFLRQPQILGFPLNTTRLIYLSTFCPRSRDYSRKFGSLDSFCSGSETLPPIQTTTIPGIPILDNPPSQENSSFTPLPAPSEIIPSASANKTSPPRPLPLPPSTMVEGSAATIDFTGSLLIGLLIFVYLHFVCRGVIPLSFIS